MTTSRRSIDRYTLAHVSKARIGELQHEVYKINHKKCAKQPSSVSELIFIRPESELFLYEVYHCSFTAIKNSTQRDDDVASELNKMVKKATELMRHRALYKREPVSIITFLKKCERACDLCETHEGVAMKLSNATYPVLPKK